MKRKLPPLNFSTTLRHPRALFMSASHHDDHLYCFCCCRLCWWYFGAVQLQLQTWNFLFKLLHYTPLMLPTIAHSWRERCEAREMLAAPRRRSRRGKSFNANSNRLSLSCDRKSFPHRQMNGANAIVETAETAVMVVTMVYKQQRHIVRPHVYSFSCVWRTCGMGELEPCFPRKYFSNSPESSILADSYGRCT